jgi:CubicO group peptidase (beta-lactamase class C family)
LRTTGALKADLYIRGTEMQTKRPASAIEWSTILERLSSAPPRTGEIGIGILTGGNRHCVSVGPSGLNLAGDGAEFIPLGCAIKVFTASLMCRLVSRGDVHWDDPVARFIRGSAGEETLPAGIKIRHLLNHTHGLDDSLLPGPPLFPDGRIDGALLCAQLRSLRTLCAPGERVSYGNAGAWLAGAVIEQARQAHYAAILTEEIFTALGLAVQLPTSRTRICPSAEDELQIRLNDMLSFLEANLEPAESEASHVPIGFNLSSLLDDPVPLPGWSPSERGACLGWKSFGDGWFGHNSLLPATTTILRMHPAKQTAIVLSGAAESTFAVYTRVFSKLLPEFSLSRLPALLDDAQLASLQMSEYEGRYENAALSVTVSSSGGTLQFQVLENRLAPSEIQIAPQQLVAAANHLFMPAARSIAQLPVLQFVRTPERRSFEYLWNGQGLLRRVG